MTEDTPDAVVKQFHKIVTEYNTTHMPEAVRHDICTFEQLITQQPDAIFGDSECCPLKHSFAEGCYVREIFIPRGMMLTGKIHRHAHPNFLMAGEVIVVTENGGIEHLVAPKSMISPPGTKRAVVALTDVWWITVHVTEETNLHKIEEHVIAPSYEAYWAFAGTKV